MEDTKDSMRSITGDFEIVYINGDSLAFKAFIDQQKDKAELVSLDGHFRWLITREDGTQYIARPDEAKNK